MEISLAPNGDLRLHTSARTHIDIPPTFAGAWAIRNILQERSYAGAPKIGEAGFPTQAQVDRWLANKRAEVRAAEHAKLQTMLGDLDLAGLDIDL